MHQNHFLSFVRQSLQNFTGTVLISTCLASVILFAIIHFRAPQERHGAEVRDCSDKGFTYHLNLIAPTQLGINRWQIGDYARYSYRRKQAPDSELLVFEREVGFHIIGVLQKEDTEGYWLKKTGFSAFRTVPVDIYRYVTVHDLRITPKTPRYSIQKNYIPLKFKSCDQTGIPLAKLIKIGEEKVETEAGTFECIHYQVEIIPDRTYLELWASPAIPPLGIIRVQSETEMLELTSFGQDREITVPRLIRPVIEGISTLNYGCNSCHEPNDPHKFIFPPK